MGGPEVLAWEFAGTALLLLLGNGVCAANTLRASAAHGTGWNLIAAGWGLAVFVGASVADPTGGHLNPAVTLALAVKGDLAWGLVPWYVAGQMLGAMVGAGLAWAAFRQLFDAEAREDSPADVGPVFFTVPAGPRNGWNAVTEFIATAVLLAFVLLGPPGGDTGPLAYLGVAAVIVAVGASLGSPTGYAINPVRDLGPRIMYAFVLPLGRLRRPGSARWGYAWVPVVAPLVAAVVLGVVARVAVGAA
ncbi:MIP/aquaporin family protein [Corynebacterium bovis]|uniref:MIP/aquaporin family protein n=1 Tax=Corynebacterium bovis TaxID=36808 RepID=UPI00313968A5